MRKLSALTAAGVVAWLAVTQAQSTPPLRWVDTKTGATARLRGISAVSDRVAWASGANGTVLRTADAGATWTKLDVPDSASLDFRDVDAVDASTAYILSIGPGDQSRIYKTTDAGATWTLQFRNEDPQAFYDAMAFADATHGYALSDSVDGRLVLLRTTDGQRWTRVPGDTLPPALQGEGAFAASGTNVAMRGRHVWLATGPRVIRSSDDGRTWAAVATPLPAAESSGNFSIAFRDDRYGLVVGGDFKKEREPSDNAAVTTDGGATWRLVRGLTGYRSAVAFVAARPGTVIAVGPSGTDVSTDDGATWRAIDGPGFHAVSVAPRSRTAWAVGENGAAARLSF
jgi:photosystem II stability/assembly factor-like uncharacterized protein